MTKWRDINKNTIIWMTNGQGITIRVGFNIFIENDVKR